jgi:hypothetical protein
MTAMFPTMAHQVVLPPGLLQSAPNLMKPPAPVEQQGDGPTVSDEDDITNPSMALPKAAIPSERDSHSGIQPHSTLGFSVGQSSLSMRSPPARWRKWMVPAGAVFVVVAAIFTAVTLRQRVTVTPNRPATTRPVVVKTKKVFWSVTSVPAGAEIYRISDGHMMGKTPWHGEQEQSDEEVPVRLSLIGYQDRIVQLKSERDDHKEITLDPLPVENLKPAIPKIKRPPFWRPPLPTKATNPPNGRPKIVD